MATTAENSLSNVSTFLKYVPETTLQTTMYGTIASGTSGGSTSLALFNPSQPPAVPVWASRATFEQSLSISLTIPAGGQVTLSPYAPYSAFSSQFTIAGSPPWDFLEHTYWFLDRMKKFQDYDEQYAGLGYDIQNTSEGNTPYGKLDIGNIPFSITPVSGAPAIIPGQTISNTGTSEVTYEYVFTWVDTIMLRQSHTTLFGTIPLGDPKNRLNVKEMLNPLVGVTPESNLFVSASSGVTCVTNAQTTSNLVFKVFDIQTLPPGIQIANPTVGMAFQVNANSESYTNAGQIQSIGHQYAMLYTDIDHLVINNQMPVRIDYFGFWETEEQKSARWEYDSQTNTFNQWYRDVKELYHRYLPPGHFPANFTVTRQPQNPSFTIYDGFVTPNVQIAQAKGIVPLPTMQTAFRVPSGTDIVSGYVRVYSKGFVGVNY